MFNKPASILLVTLLLLSAIPLTEGNSAGKYNQSAGCSCHATSGTTAANVAISGHPSSYTAGQTYTLSIAVTGGVSGNDGGFSLDVNKGSLSSGIGFAVNVDSAGTSGTQSITGSSQRSWSLDWTAPSTGSGQATLSVAGLTANGNSQNGGDRWATAVYQVPEAGGAPNTPPTASNVILGPSGATTTSTLSLIYTYADQENDAESGTTIEWFRDGAYTTNSGSTVPPSITSKGQEWYAVVTPSDGADAGTSVTSNLLVIANSVPTMNSPSITPSSPESADNLSNNYLALSVIDHDQDEITFEIRWLLEGSVVPDLDNSQQVPSYATRAGENWSMEVRASDGEATTAWQTSQTVQIGGETPNTPPSVSSAIVGPSNPVTGDNLVFTYGFTDADGDAETRSEMEWYRNGAIDPVFKGSSVPASSTAKGQSWFAKVRVNDGAAWSTWTPSNTVIIGNTPPVTTSLQLSQTNITTLEDATVQFSQSDVDGDLRANSQIIWLKDGVQINALDDSTTLFAQHTSKGEVWTVHVRAGDGTSLSETMLEAELSIINSAPSVELLLSESPSILNPLVITTTTADVDGDLQTTSIQWYRNGFLESSLSNQTTVPANLLGPGQQWSVEVTVHDGTESGTAAYGQVSVANLPPTASIEQLSPSVWIGEIVTLDASTSSDVDGQVASYTWTWSDVNGGSGSGTGATFTLIPTGAASVNLLVTDDLGATATTNLPLMPVQGPIVTELEASVDGQTVNLAWDYDGPNATFNIERNGAIVATVATQEYSDEPLISGLTTYTVRPVVDGVSLQPGASDSTVAEVMPVVETVDSQVSFSGSMIGFLLVFLGAAALGLVLFERRE
jgi:hypothetical protein|tara:strand:- start:8938 stop:11475 length:2538 start_codon:yes stop_codon:yes gene_type:complete